MTPSPATLSDLSPPATAAPLPWQPRHVRVPGGLTLFARDYSGRRDMLPILCLAGLTRNSKDFDGLARFLQARGHRVVALDSRGRGRSTRSKDWRDYHPLTEARDTVAATDALGLAHYGVVGTSRGGILAMILTALRPGQLAATVLNDIGPAIEPAGLARIKAYLGRVDRPSDWAQATALVRDVGRRDFPHRSDAEWEQVARATFVENGKGTAKTLRPDFDVDLLKTLDGVALDRALPTLWPQFMGLSHISTLAVRGARSDILSRDTLRMMAERHPRLSTVTVPDVGHAPSLMEDGVPERIADIFVNAA